MRTIADELNGQTAQAWVTTAYLITSTISTPLYGKLSDQYGRKPFYLFAIVIFVVGSVLCGLAQSIYELAAYRAVQGLGAGGLMSLAFAIVGDLVPPRERGRYQGWFMAVFGTSSVLGPVLGGAFAGQDTLLGVDGWRWIFYLNVPIGLVALVVVSRVLTLPRRTSDGAHRPHRRRAAHHDDRARAARRREGPRVGLGLGPHPRAARPVGRVAGAVRPARAGGRRGGDPAAARVPQRRLQHHQRHRRCSSAPACSAAWSSCRSTCRSCAARRRRRPGLQLIPLMVGILVTSTARRRGHVADRSLQAAAGRRHGADVRRRCCSCRRSASTPRSRRRWRTWSLMGAGLGLSMQTLVISVQNALPPQDMGVATSSVTFFRSLGGTLGAATSLAVLFGSLAGNITARAREAGLPQDGRRPLLQRLGARRQLDHRDAAGRGAGGRAAGLRRLDVRRCSSPWPSCWCRRSS